MEPIPKLTLIQNLGLVPVCSRWAGGLPGADAQSELAVKYAQLLAALATEVLESWKKVENSVLSMEAVGLAVGEDAGAEAAAACQSASVLLDALFPAVLTALRTRDDEIAASVTPFLLTYIARVRMLHKRSGGVLPPGAAAQLPAVLEAVATCARFSNDSAVYGISAEDSEEKVAGDEEEAAVAERRQELFTVFRNTAKLVPEAAAASVGRRLEVSLPQGADASWQDAELALSLAYQLGEGASEEALRPGSGPLAALATGIMRADVPAVLTSHRLVALALLETCARYAKAAATPGGVSLLPRVIGLFLGPTGLGHPSETVPPRAAYLLCRMVKTLRQQVHPLAAELLNSLRPHLAAIAASPGCQLAKGRGEEPGIKAPGASTQHGALGAGVSAADDRLYAFEAAGLLIGDDDVPEEVQLEWMWTVFRPLMTQVNEATEVALLQQALEGLTRASKGFALRVCEARPRVAAALLEPLSPAVCVLQRFPGQQSLRAKFLAYVHRIVECVGPRMTPHLPGMLWVLYQTGSDAADMADVLQLLNQSMLKLRGPELETFLRTAVPECVVKVHSFLKSDWDWSGVAAMPAMGSSPAAVARFAARLAGPAPTGSTEDLRERAELQRSYYVFLNSLANADLGQCLKGLSGSGGDIDALRAALNDLACGASTHVDASVRKICVATLGRLASDWLGADDGAPACQTGAGADVTTPTKEKGGIRGVDTPSQNVEGSLGLVPASPPIAIASGGAHPAGAIPGISEFFVQRFGCEVLIEGLAAPGSIVDVRDAAAISLLTEVAVQLQAMHRLGGAQFIGFLCGTTLPKLGWPALAVEQLVAHITQSEPKVLKDFLKQALLELRQQATGARR